MAGQCVTDFPATVDSAVDAELTTRSPVDNVAEPNVGSVENLEIKIEEVEEQDLYYQHEAQEQLRTSMEGSPSLLALPFLKKLWVIAQDNNLKSVRWNISGDSLMIEEALFQTEILHRTGTRRIFRTNNLQSFIRQLNRYGFKKVCPQDSATDSGENQVTVYRNVNFHRDKPKLLKNIWKRSSLTICSQKVRRAPTFHKRGTREALRKKKKKLLPTGSPPLNKIPEEEKKIKTEAPEDQEPVEEPSSMSASVPTESSIPQTLLNNCPPKETTGPSGEGKLECTTGVPEPSAEMKGAGDVASSCSSGISKFGRVRSFYNVCYSILTAAFSVISMRESSDEEEEEEYYEYDNEDEEEEEEASEDKCIICALFKDKSRP